MPSNNSRSQHGHAPTSRSNTPRTTANIRTSPTSSNWRNTRHESFIDNSLSFYTSLDGSSVLSVSNRDYYVDDCNILDTLPRDTFALEEHMTVARKGPTMAPQLQMFAYENEIILPSGDIGSRADVNPIGDDAVTHSTFLGSRMHQSSNYAHTSLAGIPLSGGAPSFFDVGDYWGDPNGDYNKDGTAFDSQDISMFYKRNKELVSAGDNINIPIDVSRTEEDWKAGDHLIIEHEYTDSFGSLRRATARVQIVKAREFAILGCMDSTAAGYNTNATVSDPTQCAGFVNDVQGWGYYPSAGSSLGSGGFWQESHVEATIVSITGNFPQGGVTDEDLYTVKLVQSPPIFEVKFPKFSYRYKYADGEHSVFAPWSEIAFIPGVFDFLPKKGYNLGMQNKLRSLNIVNWVPKNIPKDVVQVDILYKESNSPNIYTVSSHKKDDPAEGGGENYWNKSGSGGHKGNYTITSELIHKVVKSNQLLRPWDNVPRKALAQEVTANRLIFANYVQNYDLKDANGKEIKPRFLTSLDSIDHSMGSESPLPNYPGKSLKSMRTYQLGVVYRDTYGRETPVMTAESGSIKLAKTTAKLQNRLNVKLENDPPVWAESFTFYIKETSNEYYNIAMDRWYDAEDGGIWLSFPSSERNKISDTTNLILKKQHDTDVFTDFDTRYKVLSIKNDAPTFIKTENRYWGSLPMMLPPPGWGSLGSWDSGMFYNTGLPLPNRMFLDIFAEYWDQSIFNELTSMAGAQIRVIQSAGQASAYNATTSDTTNKTNWYDIANITYIGSPPQTQSVTTTDSTTLIETTSEVELPGQQEQLVRISLEKAFGNDASFCEPSDNLSLSRGLSIEVRTKIVRDKSQFEGRFFVKILRDANAELNIINPQLSTEDKYQVLFSRKLKYICAAHPGLQDWSKRFIDRSGTITSHPNDIPVGIPQQESNVDQGGNVLASPGTRYTFKWGKGGSDRGYGYGINEHLYSVGFNAHPRARIVSSLSYAHAGKGASFINKNNQHLEKPGGSQTGSDWLSTGYEHIMWPIGPGPSALGAFDTNGWDHPSLSHHVNLRTFPHVNKNIFPMYRRHGNQAYIGVARDGIDAGDIFGKVTSGGIQTVTTSSLGNFFHLIIPNFGVNDWPSFGPEKYSPYLKYGTDNATPPNTIDTTPYATRGIGPYENRNKTDIKDGHVLTLKDCPALGSGGMSASGLQHVPVTTSYSDNNYLQGANPVNIPAIWGNQEDFFRGNCVAGGQGCEDGISFTPSGTDKYEWNSGTFAKLREDWYYLWHGRDKVHETWPFSRFTPDRWFIDKVGAAQGYSGNGIWANETTGTGYMDISFWGIGRPDQLGLACRKHANFAQTMLEFNDNEWGFAQALRTPGTQFRFKHDPDGVVYTITGVEENDIFNYEAPQGRWGIENGGTVSGGNGIGFNSPAPSHGAHDHGPLAGGRAYISDLYSSEDELLGSHPSNKRIRFTLSLDKIIGSEGEHKFHPITNHVKPVEVGGVSMYESNIELGRAKYSTDLIHVEPHKGGTPENVEYYNLASYWNTTSNSGQYPALSDITTSGGDTTDSKLPDGTADGSATRQPEYMDLTDSDNFYARNPFAYIGLHERGLNQTEIEIVTPYRGEDRDRPMSTNPAIWETEPTEDVGLDIYYAASPSYPIDLERHRKSALHLDPNNTQDPYGANWYDYSNRGEEVIKVGSQVELIDSTITSSDIPIICNVQGNTIWLTKTDLNTESAFHDANGDQVLLNVSDTIRITWRGEGTFYGVGSDTEWMDFKIQQALSSTSYMLEPIVHNNKIGLGYFNCWSYNNGVESNRIRDDYNAVTVDKGVKASMPLATPYEEERRASGLIFSGIYNSTSGINETNQFIQAEPITKDLNPINGSIQKLFARDTDLLTFCENKVFKILAKKDALFNADGNTNVTSNAAVLGQSIPFTGEYGISRNPESFASESYRVYFTDKDRGAVLRLSKDGLTPISDQGMKDWFRDNLRFSTSLIGSYDNRDDQYNLTIDTTDQNNDRKAYTVSYTEKKRGWVSFKSFITQGGISHKNTYYTFPNNYYSRLDSISDPWDVEYAVSVKNMGELHQHGLDQKITRVVFSGANTLTSDYDPGDWSFVFTDEPGGVITRCMSVEGNGVPTDTYVELLYHHSTTTEVYFNNRINVSNGDSITFVTARDAFYGNCDHYSMVKVLFNGDKGTVKRFKALDYEGSQAKVNLGDTSAANNFGQHMIYDSLGNANSVGQIYYDNYPKLGWYVENIETDMQEGEVVEFMQKENKWFNNITGLPSVVGGDDLDTAEFSLQGLGKPKTITIITI